MNHDAAAAAAPPLDSECFFITPIGAPDSAEQRRADGLLVEVVSPAAEAVGMTPVRADRIAEGGHVTLQVLEHCAGARVAVADLTGGNLNVFYEVGLRHALRMPVVLIADYEENGRLPFDLLQQRTIFYANDMAGTAACREAVTEQLKMACTGHVDSPVQAAVNVQGLAAGDALHQVVGDLVGKVETMAAQLQGLAPSRLPRSLAAKVEVAPDEGLSAPQRARHMLAMRLIQQGLGEETALR